MADKLQELTERIYQEGVAKSKEESDRILAAARQQADEMLKKAGDDATKMRKAAEDYAADLRKNVQSEVKLASQQMLSVLKQKIADLIVGQLVAPPLQEAWNQVDFLKRLILTAAERWEPKNDLAMEISPAMMKELETFFQHEGKRLLDAGVTITPDPRLHDGFRLGPADGGYRISFSDKDFSEFFKTYLRPKAVQILYGE